MLLSLHPNIIVHVENVVSLFSSPSTSSQKVRKCVSHNFLSHTLTPPPLSSYALRTAECIVMVLGHVASHMGSKFNVVATVTGMFGQRLFHPTSPLDGKLVGELARIVTHTGVWGHGGMGV